MVNNTNRIFRNTLMLYFRQILILFVSLYSVRVVLNTLGVEDYGIYSVVGGIVSFFSFLSGTMASATQRFFSYALGENNQDKLNKTFSTNLLIYIFIAIISVILLETLGYWFVHNNLKVPLERYETACFIYHFSVMTFVFTIIASPFMAIIIAHEDMHIYAYVSIADASLKLLVVFLLRLLVWDKLKLYGILLCFVGFVNAIIYLIICLKKYEECQFKKFNWNRKLFSETISFTGWTLFGQVTSVLRVQAVTILINQVFNPLIVTARTIATQVTNQVNVFSSNFNVGLYPPIIKSYAANEKDEMFDLIFTGCKITFFLMWVFSLPLFIEMRFCLTIWLKQPPEFSVLFTRLALIEVLINTISMPIATAARASGKMRNYELSLGAIQVLIFVTDFILFKYFSVEAYIVFVVAAIFNLLMFIVRLILVRYLIDFPILRFIKTVILPIIFVAVISALFSMLFYFSLPKTIIFNLLIIFLCVIISTLCMFFFGFDKSEKKKVLEKVKNILVKHGVKKA